jgi:hypothetical protein
MKKEPSIDGKHGRDSSGKFVKGNKVAVGNQGPRNQTAKELKKVLAKTITDDDIKKIVKKCIQQAKKGNKDARKELFDRLWGRPRQGIDIKSVITLCDIAARMAGNDDSDNN